MQSIKKGECECFILDTTNGCDTIRRIWGVALILIVDNLRTKVAIAMVYAR